MRVGGEAVLGDFHWFRCPILSIPVKAHVWIIHTEIKSILYRVTTGLITMVRRVWGLIWWWYGTKA